MLRLICTGIFCALCFLDLTAQVAPFESGINRSSTYEEAIAFYQELARRHRRHFRLETHGTTDAGHPLHLGILSADGTFTPETAQKHSKCLVFINNAIHPGEPDGVDASMLLLRDILNDPSTLQSLRNVTLLVVPFYNIGGGLNRSSYSRANQNGPEAYGFRGNARNLDLNRDFIKCDSRNAQTFNRLYSRWRPHVFIDTHVSNGADYPYVMTLIATQRHKLQANLSKFLNDRMLPFLYQGMKNAGWEMTPYVNVGRSPEDGINGFLDLPRYSSGYAALHNALSFMPEAHMLKPFPERVKAMYALLRLFIAFSSQNAGEIHNVREEADKATATQDSFALNWQLDRSRFDSLLFRGYAARTKASEVSGLDRMYYDHSAPWEKQIRYYNYFLPSLTVKRPLAYIVPQAWAEVIERLQWNGVRMQRLTHDVEVEADFYYLRKFQTPNEPYEGHYPHSRTEVETRRITRIFRAGDYVIPVDQPVNRYIVETLEPQAPDAFFSWNFFDSVLDQKEHYSSYIFEDLAAEYLRENPSLRALLEKEKAQNQELAKSARAQLDFIYKNSPYYESTHQLYPVAKIFDPTTRNKLLNY
ncbi:MAG: hypothetical protein RL386_827 [Bacteroidota bacterium]|jgi:hypothetical protein